MTNCNGEQAVSGYACCGAPGVVLAAVFLLSGSPAGGQAASPNTQETFPFTFSGAQAATPEELDAFGLVQEASMPSEIIAEAEAFTQTFPNSQLLSLVQLREMKSEIEVNSYQGAVALGHTLLRTNPNNLEALILLSGVLPNFPSSYPVPLKSSALKEAQADVQNADQLLQTFHVMEGFPPRAFLTEKAKLRLSLNEAAAFVDLASGNYQRAIQEYEAIPAGSRAAASCLRLGFAYFHMGQTEKARAQLTLAMQKDTGVVGKRAASMLEQIAPKPAAPHPSSGGTHAKCPPGASIHRAPVGLTEIAQNVSLNPRTRNRALKFRLIAFITHAVIPSADNA
jgi:hypothetical protein